MKLVRYGNKGSEKPGLVGSDGKIRDISWILSDFTPESLALGSLAKLSKLYMNSLPRVHDDVRIGVPLVGCGKFVAIGLSYADHAAEANLPMPAEPMVFQKAITSLSGPNDPIMLPRDSSKTDREVELGIVIGARGAYVDRKDAAKHIAGYCVVNDVSERECQMERGGTWDKGCDTFGSVGPWIATADEVSDPQALDIWLDVNSTRMPRGNTRTMIFDCAEIVSYVSQFMTLRRHYRDRHPARGRYGQEARSRLPEARRRRHARHR